MAHSSKKQNRSILETLEERQLLTAAVVSAANLIPAITANDITPDVLTSTTTSVTSSATGNTSIYGGNVTFTATVTGTTPTGNVTFMDGNITLGNGTFAGNGTWTFTISSLNAASHTITASYSGDTNNDVSTSGNLTLSVTPKALTVTGITAANKTYDTTTSDTLNTGNATLVGLVSGDTVVLHTGNATGAFADANAGGNKTVSVSGLTIDGSSATNYTLTQPTATATISAKTITVTGITATDKVYDGVNTATLDLSGATTTGIFLSDNANVTLNTSSAHGTFSTKNVGNGLTVTVTGVALSGTAGSNYIVTQPTGLTANITPKQLTVSGTITAANKTYDGTNKATITTKNLALSGVVTGDVVTFTHTTVTGAFSDANAGTGKAVLISGLSISGAGASNYTLGPTFVTATISPKAIKLTGATVTSKTYDGTTTATITGGTLSGALTADSANVTLSSITGVFSTANVGTNKVTATVALSGSAASNYAVTALSLSGKITAKALTVTGVTAASKVYDGTTTATLNTSAAVLSGLVASDDGLVLLNLAAATGTYSTKNVGTGLAVTIKGITISGTAAKNYTFTQPTGITGNITPKTLTLSGITAANKVYNGNSIATINHATTALNGVVSADGKNVVVSFSNAAANFTVLVSNAPVSDGNVGNGKTVTIGGLVLTGSAAANYVLTAPTAVANITPATLTVTGITAANKVYDGNTTGPTLDTSDAALTGVVSTDLANVSLNAASASAANYSSANAGSYTLAVSGLTLTGTASTNYTLTQPTVSSSITPAPITIGGITATGKVYDGNTKATIDASDPTVSGILNSDLEFVSVDTSAAVGTYTDANAGVAKTIHVGGITLSGLAASNYFVDTVTTTATISARHITLSGVTANNKVYDGTDTATLNTTGAIVNGILASDLHNFTLSNLTATFATADATSDIPVTLTLGGASGGNYIIDTTLSASITPATITVTGITADKVYDGTTDATLDLDNAVLTGVVGDDVISLTYDSASYATSNAGSGIAVTPVNLVLTGEKSGDYILTQPTITGTISQATLTLDGVAVNTKNYDGTNAATFDTSGATLNGVIGLDDVSLGTVTGTFDSVNASGDPISVTVSNVTLTGDQAANYTVTPPTLAGTINPVELTVTGITASDKPFDGTTSASIDTSGAVLHGVIGDENVTLDLTNAVGTFSDPDPGVNKTVTITGVTLTGDAAINYTLDPITTTASIIAS